MNTFSAMMCGHISRNNELMVFDWDKAAQIIRDEHPDEVVAGLAGDFEYTGGTIYENGAPVPEEDSYVFLASTWATPQICIDGAYRDCYRMKSETPNWDAHTYWPKSALAILNGDI